MHKEMSIRRREVEMERQRERERRKEVRYGIRSILEAIYSCQSVYYLKLPNLMAAVLGCALFFTAEVHCDHTGNKLKFDQRHSCGLFVKGIDKNRNANLPEKRGSLFWWWGRISSLA